MGCTSQCSRCRVYGVVCTLKALRSRCSVYAQSAAFTLWWVRPRRSVHGVGYELGALRSRRSVCAQGAAFTLKCMRPGRRVHVVVYAPEALPSRCYKVPYQSSGHHTRVRWLEVRRLLPDYDGCYQSSGDSVGGTKVATRLRRLLPDYEGCYQTSSSDSVGGTKVPTRLRRLLPDYEGCYQTTKVATRQVRGTRGSYQTTMVATRVRSTIESARVPWNLLGYEVAYLSIMESTKVRSIPPAYARGLGTRRSRCGVFARSAAFTLRGIHLERCVHAIGCTLGGAAFTLGGLRSGRCVHAIRCTLGALRSRWGVSRL
jgi:hypothetical protein